MKRYSAVFITLISILSLSFPVISNAKQSTATPAYQDSSLPVAQRVADLLGRMTTDEKIGQMTLVEKNGISGTDITDKFIGGLLSGGGETPDSNTPQAWVDMLKGFEQQALQTRLAIPLIYGIDAVHGHNNVLGATIYPHNIGLGAANDPDLVQRIGRATAEEMVATGIRWDYAPVVAVVQDYRWGRSYESYSENTDLVTKLSSAFIKGLQGTNLADPTSVMATPKHFIGDGGTTWGSSTSGNYEIDQGDTRVDLPTLRALFLPPYTEAVKDGAVSIMASFSSWNGLKMHAQKPLLTDLLKGELGFKGFIVSDWGAIDQITPDYYQAVVTSINAGVDMNMVPTKYQDFISTMQQAVQKGDISMDRINDAVSRILTAKFELGLFENPIANGEPLGMIGSDAHRALAREAVNKSLVLLQNNNKTLPLSKDVSQIIVAGDQADDIGMQTGGWTLSWQGMPGNAEPGTSILTGIKNAVSKNTTVTYDSSGNFDNSTMADVGIAVVGEKPYAEGVGDSNYLNITRGDSNVIQSVRDHSKKLIVILVSGRPMVINDQLKISDAFIAAWLPGTEGEGVADDLFGDKPFTGKLPFTWLRSMDQLPFDFKNLPTSGCDAPLFPFGYGLDATSTGPIITGACS